jgi:hypothetical protein
MKKLSLALLLLLPFTLNAAPELKSNPEDLRGFLHPRNNIISISADAEETAYSDQALEITLTPISFNESNVRFHATAGANVLGRAMKAQAQQDLSYLSKLAAPVKPTANSFDEVKYHGNITVQFKVQ